LPTWSLTRARSHLLADSPAHSPTVVKSPWSKYGVRHHTFSSPRIGGDTAGWDKEHVALVASASEAWKAQAAAEAELDGVRGSC